MVAATAQFLRVNFILERILPSMYFLFAAGETEAERDSSTADRGTKTAVQTENSKPLEIP